MSKAPSWEQGKDTSVHRLFLPQVILLVVTEKSTHSRPLLFFFLPDYRVQLLLSSTKLPPDHAQSYLTKT